MEEIDLCWRVKNLGYKVMYSAASTIYHVGGGTLNADSPFKTYLNFRNNHFLIKKNIKPEKANWIILFRFCLDFLALIKFCAEGKFKNAWAISKAHQHIIKAFLDKKVIYNTDVIDKPNLTGMYGKSVVWQYFGLKKNTFNQL
jgi:hypothetical protein